MFPSLFCAHHCTKLQPYLTPHHHHNHTPTHSHTHTHTHTHRPACVVAPPRNWMDEVVVHVQSPWVVRLSLPLPLPLLLVGALMPRGTVMRFVDLGRVPRVVTKPGEYSGMLSLLDTVPASLLLSSPSSFTLNESPRVPSTPGPVSTPGPSPSL